MSERVYIAGPMTGYEEFNHPAFHEAEEYIRDVSRRHPDRDFEPVNPVEPGDLDEDGNATKPKEEYLKRDIRRLLDCDMIALLNGWKDSSGARAELHVAKAINLTVTHLDLDNSLWREIYNSETILRQAEDRLRGPDREDGMASMNSMERVASIRSGFLESTDGDDVEPRHVVLSRVSSLVVDLAKEYHRDAAIRLAELAALIEIVEDDDVDDENNVFRKIQSKDSTEVKNYAND